MIITLLLIYILLTVICESDCRDIDAEYDRELAEYEHRETMRKLDEISKNKSNSGKKRRTTIICKDKYGNTYAKEVYEDVSDDIASEVDYD